MSYSDYGDDPRWPVVKSKVFPKLNQTETIEPNSTRLMASGNGAMSLVVSETQFKTYVSQKIWADLYYSF